MAATLLLLEALKEALIDEDDLPPRGSRVRRGRDWKWGNQDGQGPGTIVGYESPRVVNVEWDNGRTNTYRHGAEGAMDLNIVDEPRNLTPEEIKNGIIKVGCNVKRGKDWKWGDQDGTPGNTGMVFDIKDTVGWAKVQWKEGKRADYRYGKDNCYDLQIIMANGMTADLPTAAKSSPARSLSSGGMIQCWQWQDDSDIWRLYANNVADQMETIYQRDSTSVVPAKLNNKEYNVNFQTMKQTSKSSGKSRKIKRSEMSLEDYELARSIEESMTEAQVQK